VKALVEAMPKSSMKGQNISMDRLYTSISTCNWLLNRNITTVGTLVTNRIGLPDELKDAKQREEFESTIHWDKDTGNLALCAYTTKSKSKGKKNVLVLSTMRPLMGITRDDGKLKPAVIKFYDFTKGGTDIVDQKISKYSCKSVTNKWTMVHFYFLLDTIRCNALTLYAIKHNKSLSQVNSFSNGWELVTSLVKPFIAARPTIGLNLNTRSKMSIILGRALEQNVPVADEHSRFGETKQRCDICLYDISGDGQKNKKECIEKLKSRCQKCGNPVCDQHSKLICEKHY